MDYKEQYIGNKEKFYFFLKDEVIKLFKDKLKIDGARVLIPDNEELNYEFDLETDENYGNFTIKVKWGEKTKKTEVLKGNTNINSDGMEITTNISLDYEPFKS